jgi:hypothetical protein
LGIDNKETSKEGSDERHKASNKRKYISFLKKVERNTCPSKTQNSGRTDRLTINIINGDRRKRHDDELYYNNVTTTSSV